jgi:hypothetical protein
MIAPDDTPLMGVWRIAGQFECYEMFEYLISKGLDPKLFASSNSLLCWNLGIGPGTDLCIHLGTQTDANIPADRLTNSQFRQQPELAIDGLAERCFASSPPLWLAAVGWWCDQGLLSTMVNPRSVLVESFVNSARLLGKNAFPPERYPSITGATQAQQAQMLVEFLSDVLCSAEWPLCFSSLKLTVQGEQTMNPIAVAQGDLMMKGIDR